mmetsp:Transcript_6177/g.14606  ORF Transcript_6177/g.14606 Transcript_6177/m.14606 type:complete len:240 (-) Transcript_6177:822-1541(-)
MTLFTAACILSPAGGGDVEAFDGAATPFAAPPPCLAAASGDDSDFALAAFSFSARRFSAFSFLALARRFVRRASSMSFRKSANFLSVSAIGVFGFSAKRSMHFLQDSVTSSTWPRKVPSCPWAALTKLCIALQNLSSFTWPAPAASLPSASLLLTEASTLATALSSSLRRRTESSKSIFEAASQSFMSSKASSRTALSISSVSMRNRIKEYVLSPAPSTRTSSGRVSSVNPGWQPLAVP